MPVESLILLAVIALISYVIGSFPTGYLIARSRGIDIFAHGSGNMGATNIARVMGGGWRGILWAVLVWFLDSAKGVIAILISLRILPENPAGATVIAALFAIIGHNWSLFIAIITGKIRGGKGAATAFGTLLMIVPVQVIAAMLVIGGVIIALTRYVSLAVLIMFALATVWMIVLFSQHLIPSEFMAYSLVMAALLVIRFRTNIKRLLEGTERRLGEPA
ncbi:MAG: glycerol-3-phosphate acyltransferase [Candidatus Flexifilum sp.]|jgi:glycerol-3-phosphate acyltransferase PlsY